MAKYKLVLTLTNGNTINAGEFEVAEPEKPLLKNVTLTANGWVASSNPVGWKYVISDGDITEDSIVDFIQDNSSADAWSDIGAYPMTVSANGSVTLYAENQPTENIKGYYSITNAELVITKSYEDLVAETYPGYAILHGTLNDLQSQYGTGYPTGLTITSGQYASGNKAIIIDSANVGDSYTSVIDVGEANYSYYGGSQYPSVSPDVSANTTLLLWNGSSFTSKENGEV